MNPILLIDSRVLTQPYIDYRKPNVDYIVFDYYTDTFNSLCDKIESDKYNQVGLVQHADFNSGFNILRKETVGMNSDTEPYLTFTSLLEFMTKIKLKGVQTFDFLGCGLYDPINTPAIFAYLEGASGLDLRASTNLTGASPGDWIMESDNVNIKSVYWTDDIDQYKGTLNAVSNFPFYGTNKTIKDINGNVIFLNKDKYGNPLNPAIDSNGVQIKQIASSVVAWGTSAGGDVTTPNNVSADLTSGVVAIYSTMTAFSALKTDGTIVAWGILGGNSISSINNSNITTVCSTSYAFAGLKSNGTVVAWGDGASGGTISSNVAAILNSGSVVIEIYSSGYAFAALKADRTVVSWGSGGNSIIPSNVVVDNVATIYSNNNGFVALKNNGTVVGWGSSLSPPVGLDNVKIIFNTNNAFAALKNDETVVTWGDANEGGANPGNLTNVKMIYSNPTAFVALKNNNSVVAWGNTDNGGSIPSGLDVSNVNTIYSNVCAFAALKNDCSVVSWGFSPFGGSIPSGLDVSNVIAVYSSELAFVALKHNKTIVAWGSQSAGGVIPENLDVTNIARVYSTQNAFAALKYDKSVIAWGYPDRGATLPANFVQNDTVAIYSTGFSLAALKNINAPTPTLPNAGVTGICSCGEGIPIDPNAGGGSDPNGGGPSDPNGGGGGGIPGGGMGMGGGGGSTDHFFINDPFTISQTASIFSQSLAVPFTNQYDYILDININGVWSSMNNLFAERRFMTEFTYNDSNYDSVHLNVDRTSLASLLTTASVVSISSDNESIYLDHAGVYGTLDNQTDQLAGFRFLEIVATKIFGHAKTKIAIENSNEYYINDYTDANTAVNSLIGQIAKGIFNSVITKKVDIMNDYIATDRLEDNTHNAPLIDINGYPHPFMEFNFNDTVWEFPIVFHTELSSTSNSSIGELNTGPDTGGARLVNGVMDVPVLLRFSA